MAATLLELETMISAITYRCYAAPVTAQRGQSNMNHGENNESKPMVDGGYVLYAKAMLDSTLWNLGPDALRVATWLILKAKHTKEPKKLIDCTIRRGEVVTSLSHISDGTEWYENRTVRSYSRHKIRRIIQTLCDIGFCSVNSNAYGTHISICKYELYQTSANYKSNNAGTPTQQGRTLAQQGRTPTQLYKESKRNNKNIYKKPLLSPSGNSGGNGLGLEIDLPVVEKPKKKKSKKQLTPTEKKKHRVDENTDLMIRLGKLVGRSPKTKWTLYESESLESLGDIPEAEIQAMEALYAHPGPRGMDDPLFRRQAIETILNNWNKEVDKANAFVSQQEAINGTKDSQYNQEF
jgi:hypothetical protein